MTKTPIRRGKRTRRAPPSERGHDLYETCPEATWTLIACEKLPKRIWEPCCGKGAISRVLVEAGHTVYSSDIAEHGFDGQDTVGDFLRASIVPGRSRAIVTNPPFKGNSGLPFVEHAVQLGVKVCMLLPVSFLAGSTRYSLMTSGALARVLIFSGRLPRMHRDGWTGPRATATEDFAWFIIDPGHVGRPTLHFVKWQDHARR